MSDIDLATPDTSQPDMGVPDSQPPIPDSGGGCDHPPVIENCSNGWCNIPAGCFTMGSPTTEAPCRGGDEQERSVSLTHNFEIQRHETTQAQFQGLMGYNPSWFSASGSGADCGADCPVENINWHEATAYCNALSADKCYDCAGTLENVTCTIKSEFEGAQISSCSGYRLPTESEWEYAYRAGTTTAFYNGPITNCHNQDPNAELISWYTNNANSTTHPVGLNDPSPRQPNAWGLYDMSGNVGEWCSDWHSAEPWSSGTVDPAGPTTGLNRMSRGGAYHYNPGWLRAALRDFHDPLNRLSRVGFRCVRSL